MRNESIALPLDTTLRQLLQLGLAEYWDGAEARDAKRALKSGTAEIGFDMVDGSAVVFLQFENRPTPPEAARRKARPDAPEPGSPR